MPLDFDVEPSPLNFLNNLLQLVVVLAKEDAVVNINHEDDIILIKDTVVNQ